MSLPPLTATSFALVLLLAACGGTGPTASSWRWRGQDSGSRASLRGLCAVDDRIAWASGSGGTVLRTVDGESWEDVSVEGAGELDFRDVHAFDERRAVVLSAGAPTRAFRTEDGGRSWALVYENTDERAFFDALDFWDASSGIAFSDPVGERLLAIVTDDGGRSWRTLEPEVLPGSPQGEAGFAASGTCLRTSGEVTAWIGLGGVTGARLFRTEDRGLCWSVVETPLRSGLPSTGIFSVLPLAGGRGVLVGGDYSSPGDAAQVAATTGDGGATWELVEDGPGGFRSCVELLLGEPGPTLVAVGSHGGDISLDAGQSWQPLPDEGFHVLSCGAPGVLWAAGADGRIARLERGAP